MSKLLCSWCAISNATLLNIEWPDANSQYYGTIINTSKFSIDGYFPYSKYFSFEAYDIETWSPFYSIYDQEINNDYNPYNHNITYNSSNTYNIDFNLPTNYSAYILIYRLYMGIDLYGGVSLPNITINDQIIPQCPSDNRPVIDIQDSEPSYVLYKANQDNNFYPPYSKSHLFINENARYMASFYNNSNRSFNYAKIVIKFPSFPLNLSSIYSNKYQTRYFSISTIDLSSPKQTYQTIHDSQFNYQHQILFIHCSNYSQLSIHLNPPAKNDSYKCITQTKYFGILYRQLLPNFDYMIPDRFMSKHELMSNMKDYYPEIYYF